MHSLKFTIFFYFIFVVTVDSNFPRGSILPPCIVPEDLRDGTLWISLLIIFRESCFGVAGSP